MAWWYFLKISEPGQSRDTDFRRLVQAKAKRDYPRKQERNWAPTRMGKYGGTPDKGEKLEQQRTQS